MNEKEGRPDPDDEGEKGDDARTIGAVPARNPQRGRESTSTGSSGASTSGIDPTVGMEHTESYAPGRTAPTADAAPPPGPVISPAPKPMSTKEGQVIANRFVVHRLLGQGGMGRVYAVQDRQIEGRDVALKVLLPKYSKNAQFRKLFFQEVRAAQEFVSEYICQVRDTGETEDGSLFFTMDMVEGESLRALLDREKILGPRQALEITRQVLLGLHSGHEKGYVHRDIKPSNVMLAARVAKTDTNPYGVGVRLLDFGIAGLATEIDERSRAGTVMYMSPEQASGERLDPRSDLFAVGVLLFEMLSGHRPFDGSTTRALVQSVLETNLTARLGEIPNLSKPVRKLLERSLQKDRNKRFQSATDFADEIAKSAAYKLPQNVPTWVYAGLAVFGIAAIGEGVVLSQHSTEVDSLRLQVAGINGLISKARLEVASQKDTEVQGIQASLSKLEGDYRKASEDLERARVENGDLNRKLGAASQSGIDEAQIQALITESQKPLNMRIGDLEKQKDFADRQIADLQKKAADLDNENKTLKLQLKPEGRKAETFDKMLTAIEEDRGDTALDQLSDASRVYSVFLNQGLDGVAFLSALATTSAELRKHSQGLAKQGKPDMEAVSRALDAYDKCKQELASFPSQAEGWLKFQLGDQPPPDRVDRARKAVDRLGKKLDAVRQAAEQGHDGAWASLSQASWVSDPDAVFAHADRFRCTEHIALAAEHVVDVLRAELAPAGVLNQDRLRAQSTLSKWVARLDAARFPLETSKEYDLRAFEFAQRWYGDGDARSMDWKFARPPAAKAASSDWHQVLYLQWQLSQDNASFPIKKGRTQLYRQQEPNKVAAWGRNTARGDSRFAVEYQAYDEKGFQKGTADLTEFAFVDGALRVKDSDVTIVDLHARGPGLSVAPFPALSEATVVPPSLVSEADLRKFRDFVKSHDLVCLVVKETGRERWFSPEFGLVLDDNAGLLRRELVSATGVQ